LILLDTNVVSEAMRAVPDPVVVRWLLAQPSDALAISSVTLAELLFGLAILPAGKRKTAMATSVSHWLDGVAEVLPFDDAAARRFADLAATARAAGRGFPSPDGYIAAIASARGLAVATRDTGPFLAAGLTVINPWRHPAG
jgi:predicted nucleic acid-binding protein